MACEFYLTPSEYCPKHDTKPVDFGNGSTWELCEEHRKLLEEITSHDAGFILPLWSDVEPSYFPHTHDDRLHEHRMEQSIIPGIRYCIRCGAHQNKGD
jgi:hypothetical protein